MAYDGFHAVGALYEALVVIKIAVAGTTLVEPGQNNVGKVRRQFVELCFVLHESSRGCARSRPGAPGPPR